MLPLLKPITLGSIELKNRLVMAPLTRARATGADGRTPNALMQTYYEQRATAGLIISEATSVTPMGVGYENTPGIWSEDHVQAWSQITQGVHARGGKIILQLWHVGRVSDPSLLNGSLPVAPSPIAPNGMVSLLQPRRPYVVPRPLGLEELPGVVESYRKGAENAKRAGFDGVEIHGANGYLLDQFLQDGSNHRTDLYGGSLQNRARLMLEVTDAVVSVWGAQQVGMHLAPRGDTASMGDSNLSATFSYIAKELGRRKLAFLCLREYSAPDSLGPQLKKLFQGPVIVNERFTFKTAEEAIERGEGEAVAFGQDFLANPDLVKRYELKAKLNERVPQTYYAHGSLGYTDYPFLET